jgi:GTP-binding protein YchF
MHLGILGLPQSGKTTVFNALTGQGVPTGAGGHGKIEVHLASATVPDSRVDMLSSMYNPKKTVYATVAFVDIDFPAADDPAGLPGQVKNELAKADALLHVVRAFTSAGVPHPFGSVDVARDLASVRSELLLSDLLTVEARLERLKAEWPKKKGDERKLNEEENAILTRFHDHLSAERPLRDLADVAPSDHRLVRGFGLFTLRPELVVVNCNEGEVAGAARLAGDDRHTVALCGVLEAEIAQLAPSDRQAFLEEFGLEAPAAERVIRMSYELLGVHSFFTVGEDEVRAWELSAGETAVDAAGVIHTDLARGFIRAETTAYDDLVALGDMHKVKAAGRQRLEGKTYVVQDGDILMIRAAT